MNEMTHFRGTYYELKNCSVLIVSENGTSRNRAYFAARVLYSIKSC